MMNRVGCDGPCRLTVPAETHGPVSGGPPPYDSLNNVLFSRLLNCKTLVHNTYNTQNTAKPTVYVTGVASGQQSTISRYVLGESKLYMDF